MQVDNQINLLRYLELNQKMVGRRNVLKKVKSLTFKTDYNHNYFHSIVQSLD